MKRGLIYSLVIVVCISLMSANAFAKSVAWLIDSVDSKAQKINVGENKILTTTTPSNLYTSRLLQNWENALFADPGSNQLFVIYDYPGKSMGQGLKIYNLKDLTFKKDLGITSKSPDFVLPKVIVPSAGTKFYVIWWNRAKEVNGEGGETYSIYDKTSLSKIIDLSEFPINLDRPWMMSADGSKIYSVKIKTNEIFVYDSTTLELKETISIANLWSAPLFGKNVATSNEFIGVGNKILLQENIKTSKADPDNIRYFVYDLLTKAISNKIVIKEDGEEVLTPEGNKIIINETQYMRNVSGSVTEIKHLNKLSIYDVVSGQKLKYIDLSAKYKSVAISGVSLDSTKLYLAAENIQTGATTLIVIGLTASYNIITQLPVEGTWMLFFEE